MKLFTPARDLKQNCDAYLIDTARQARSLRLAAAPHPGIIAALLDRLVLMGRSMYSVRNRVFALFFATGPEHLDLAVTEPFHAGVTAALSDTLAEFGPVVTTGDGLLHELGVQPLVAYERGKVALFHSGATHEYVKLAGQRALRILSAACSHAPAEHFEVDGQPVLEFLARGAGGPGGGGERGIEIDIAAMGDLSDEELYRLLEDQLGDVQDKDQRRPS